MHPGEWAVATEDILFTFESDPPEKLGVIVEPAQKDSDAIEFGSFTSWSSSSSTLCLLLGVDTASYLAACLSADRQILASIPANCMRVGRSSLSSKRSRMKRRTGAWK